VTVEAIQQFVASRAQEKLDADLLELRRRVIDALETFGADTGARKVALVGELLQGNDGTAVGASEPWTLAQREAQILEDLRRRLGIPAP
jgi:hypothetical protein